MATRPTKNNVAKAGIACPGGRKTASNGTKISK